MKIFWLKHNYLYLPKEHRANNGCPVAQVIIMTKSKKRVSEILNTSLHMLNTYGLIQVISEDKDFGPSLSLKNIPEDLQEDVIWYKPDYIQGEGYNKDKWFKYEDI